MPSAAPGQVLIEVKAFGINHAEIYFRQGIWGDVAEISGIECVGVVKDDPSGHLQTGQTVFALVGGMGRSVDGSYAAYTVVPTSNVVAVDSALDWTVLAAIPESYGTAWSCLHGNLAIRAGQTLLIRGATSALGRAAVNIAAKLGAHVIATTRKPERFADLRAIGAGNTLIEGDTLQAQMRDHYDDGVDAVLDLIGNSTILASLAMARRGGRVCQAGFLGSGGPLVQLEPVFDFPSERHLSVFASALVLGSAEFPLADIPFQRIVDEVERGYYRAAPAHVFEFDEIQAAHRLVESGLAHGKIVVRI